MRSTLLRVAVTLSMLAGLLAVTAAPGTAQNGADPDQAEAAQVDRSGRGYYVVQLDGPIAAATADALRLAGAELLSYVPDFAYEVRMRPAAVDRVTVVAGVTGVAAVTSSDKLADDLAASGIYRVRTQRGVDAAAVAPDVAAAGVDVLTASGRVLTVSGDEAALGTVARLADVEWVENFTLRETHNEYGAGSISGTAAANANGYDGSSQIVAVADTGLGGGTAATAHADIPASRIVAVNNWPGIPVQGCYRVFGDGAQDVDSGHGTHVATSVLGDGNAAGVGTGSAPGARLVFQAIEDFADMRGACAATNPDGYYLIGLPDDFTGLFTQAYSAGARIHSNSWGSAVNGDYTSDSVVVDTFMWNNRDMLVTYSAGNAGIDANANGVVDDDSIGSPATSKNVLTVGASENDRGGNWGCDEVADNEAGCNSGQNTIFTYGSAWPEDYPTAPISTDPSAGNTQQMAAFSSRGPTDDGRIKPDVVAPGTWILSGYSDLYQSGYDAGTNPRNGAFQYNGWGVPFSSTYKYMGGTSMSNPITAGAAAVVRDYYSEAQAHAASAALTKATLINSAVDLLDENNDGGNDNDFPIPNSHEGWGRIDANAATDGSASFVDQTTGLTTGASSTTSYSLEGGAAFKVTLVWTDFPSTAAAAVNLVNDLDLTVTSPTGPVYRGNVFSGGWSTTGGAADRLNNVENVYLQGAAAGTWTVTVTGFNVPMGPQPFAVVVDGAGAPSNDPPVAGFTDSCTALACEFTDTSTDIDGTIVSRSWDFGDGGTSTDTDPSHTYATDGTYTVTLTVTDDDAATDTETRDITVSTTPTNDPPVAGFTDSCTGLECDFTDTSTDTDGTIVSRSWDFGDGGTSTDTDPSHTYATSGTYPVTLTVTDDDAATDSETLDVTVTGGGGGTTMHVADLDGTAVAGVGKQWTATATITIRDDTGVVVSGATVSGQWRGGSTLTCVTSAAGTCSISLVNTTKAAEMFTVTGVSHAGLAYSPGSNTDPEADSDGTRITIARPPRPANIL